MLSTINMVVLHVTSPPAKKNPGSAPGVNEGFGCNHRVCSFGMIRIRISDPRSLGS